MKKNPQKKKKWKKGKIDAPSRIPFVFFQLFLVHVEGDNGPQMAC
jgi:hypothetical protein